MNELQRKGFLNIVQENGTYPNFYETRYEKADSGLVEKNQVQINAHLKLIEEKKAIEAKNKEAETKLNNEHNSERRALQEKQNKEMDILEKRLGSETDSTNRVANKAVEAVEKKADKIRGGLEEKGLKLAYHYNDNDRQNEWEVDDSRFRDQYDNWRRTLVAEILATDDAKEALKLVKQFIPKLDN